MPRKISWAGLHKRPAGERVHIVTELLYVARQNGASFFTEDGTITVSKQELFTTFFTGVVDMRRAQNLISLLQSRDVIKSNGKRGRGGATLRLNDDAASTAVSTKKTQPKQGVSTKASDLPEPGKPPAEAIESHPVKLTVPQMRVQIHKQLKAAEHEYAAAAEHLSNLQAAARMVDALDDKMDPTALRGALAAVHTVFG